MKKPRLFATLGVLAVVVAAIVFIPLPYRIVAPMEIRPRDAESVYVIVEGDLAEVYVKPGDRVTAGHVLAQLVNKDLELKIAELRGQRDQLKSKLSSLEQAQFSDTTNQTAGQIATVQESLASIQIQLKEMLDDHARLTLVAVTSGTIIAPESQQPKPHDNLMLPTWTGTPLEPKNLGVTLKAPTLFCQIGDPKQMNATVIVDQSEIDFVAKGQTVNVKIDVLPHDKFTTTLDDPSAEKLRHASKQLSSKGYGELETVTDESGMEVPINTSYPVTALIEDQEGIIRPGMRGRAKIHAGYQTLGQRGWRWLKKTFNFDL